MEIILRYIQERGIYVIGFTAPYRPTMYQALVEGGTHQYVFEELPDLQALLDRYHFAYFDFTDPDKLGLTDDDFLDGRHSSEYGTLLLYTELVRQLPDRLGSFSDLQFLQQTARQATNHFDVFGNLRVSISAVQ